MNEKLKFDTESIKDVNKIEKDVNDEEEIYAEIKKTQLNEDFKNCCQSETENIFVNKVRTLSEFVTNDLGNNLDLIPKNNTFLKSAKGILLKIFF
jgi:hypothetical protein